MSSLTQLIESAPILPEVLRRACSVSAGSGLLDRDYALLASVLQLDIRWSAEVQGYATRHYSGENADRVVRRICAATARVQSGSLTLHDGATQAGRVAPRRRQVDFHKAALYLSTEMATSLPVESVHGDQALDALLPASIKGLRRISGYTPTPAAVDTVHTLWSRVKEVLLDYPDLHFTSNAFAAMEAACPPSIPPASFTAVRRLLVGTRPDHRVAARPSILAAYSQRLWPTDWTLVRSHVADLIRADPAIGALSPTARDVAVRPYIRSLSARAPDPNHNPEGEMSNAILQVAL
ncbi:MAG: hypothetical protein ACYCWN_10380 [Ferrimicrobium sp.]|uniref:DUF222 domain-containing protein n=1 Tax=Ferrimicrobium acidiphilum TaxID=121039 RepID=A0ABV3Y5Z3_9ACTN